MRPWSRAVLMGVVRNGWREVRTLRGESAVMSRPAAHGTAHRDRLERDRDSQQPDQQDTDNSEHQDTLIQLNIQGDRDTDPTPGFRPLRADVERIFGWRERQAAVRTLTIP